MCMCQGETKCLLYSFWKTSVGHMTNFTQDDMKYNKLKRNYTLGGLGQMANCAKDDLDKNNSVQADEMGKNEN